MERIRELDGVRGLAAVVILLYHLRPGGAVPMGWAAVDLFFVLSGYLITSIILKHLDSPGFLRAFYIRRGLRIWPPYLLAIAALVLVDASLGDRLPLNYLPSLLTFTQGLPWLAGPHTASPAYFGHCWTLAIEEQFYLLWPALLLIFGRRGVWPLAGGFIALSLAMRGMGASPFVLVARCDGFACGALVASLLRDQARLGLSTRTLRTGLGLSALAMFVYTSAKLYGPRYGWIEPPGSALLGLNVLFASLVGLLVLGGGAAWTAWLRSRPLVYLGQISYGLYLYHALVFFLVFTAAQGLGFGPSMGRDAVALGLTWVVATISWRHLELPLLSLKDRYPYNAGARPTGPRSEFLPTAEVPAGA